MIIKPSAASILSVTGSLSIVNEGIARFTDTFTNGLSQCRPCFIYVVLNVLKCIMKVSYVNIYLRHDRTHILNMTGHSCKALDNHDNTPIRESLTPCWMISGTHY